MAHKPIHTLLTLFSVGGMVALLSVFLPKNGLVLTNEITLKFPSIDQLKVLEDEQDSSLLSKGNVDEFLELYTVEIDSMIITDSLENPQLESIRKRQNVLKIQYPDSNLAVLNNFFKALELSSRFPVRILHYGDSQIEGDRMSGFLRNEFQKQFSGTGCGLVPIFETFPTFAINQSDSDNWKRYAAFFNKNKHPQHHRFGLMANYSRFTDAVADTLLDSLEITKAWVRFSPNKKGYRRAGKFNKIRLLYGYNRRNVVAKITVNDKLIIIDTLAPTQQASSVIWPLPDFPNDLKIEFEGVDSPDFYGISLESRDGIHLDNIGMRGSSGTFFSKLNREVLKAQYRELEPNLILLQYGGNTVPSIHSKQKAKEYGRWFASQIGLLKKLIPNASFIVIGPSDMSEEVDGKLQTRKYLEDVRDALKQAAFDSGAAFWDLYEVMGGKNSMVSWVEADPPMAAYDYTHFAPRGAKKLSKLFYTTLMDDYQLWKNNLP